MGLKCLLTSDLNLLGNEYNYFTTYFNVGYAVFLVSVQGG